MRSTADLAQRDENTNQLFEAIAAKNMEEIKRLAQLDIDWTKTVTIDEGPRTPLDRAAIYKLWEVIELFNDKIEKSLSQTTLDDDIFQYGSAILHATGSNQHNLVKLLLQSRAVQLTHKLHITEWHYMNTKDFALHCAVENKQPEMITLLLEHGYPLNYKNNNRMTAWKLAHDKGAWQCLTAIIEHANPTDTFFSTLLPKTLVNYPTDILLKMLIKNIQIGGAGYQHEALQEKRLEILNELVTLPTKEKLDALNKANNKNTLLGNYLLCHKLGPWDAIFNSERGADSFQKRINEELAIIKQQQALFTTAQLVSTHYPDWELADTSCEGIELGTAIKHQDDSDDSLESISLEDSSDQAAFSFKR